MGTGAKWVSPFHPVTKGTSDSQNNRCRFAHRMAPRHFMHRMRHVMMIVPGSNSAYQADYKG